LFLPAFVLEERPIYLQLALSNGCNGISEPSSCRINGDFLWARARRYRMPENSIPKEAAYQIINDELMLDGNPRLNLASFVTTWMEPECDKLIMAAINKNYVDMDEYPVTTELQVHSPSAILLFTLSLACRAVLSDRRDGSWSAKVG
jgi:hypothetical protein